MPDSTPSSLTSRQAAQFLRIGRTKLWELTRDGVLQAQRIGKGPTAPLRYDTIELVRWLESNRIPAGGPPPTWRAAGSGPSKRPGSRVTAVRVVPLAELP